MSTNEKFDCEKHIRLCHGEIFGRNHGSVEEDLENLILWAAHGWKLSDDAMKSLVREEKRLGLE
jgi:hypothetical protein